MYGVLKRVIFCVFFGSGSSLIVHASQLDVKKEIAGHKSFSTQSHQLQGADIFKMYEKRQKKLERVGGLLKESKPEKTLVEKKLALLMKLYRQQYSTFEAQVNAKNTGLNPNANMKYRNIIKEMKGLLEGMNQQDIPYLERYQKAMYCHELFSDLEALLKNNASKETKAKLGIEERLSHGRQALSTGGSGEMDYAARKRGDLSREEELENTNSVIVVSGSVGKQHGLDKLIEDDLE